MSAKKAKPTSPSVAPTPAAASRAPVASIPTTTPAPESWFDSADPRKRTLARVALVGIWIYIAALWLLALDQTFDWGIF